MDEFTPKALAQTDIIKEIDEEKRPDDSLAFDEDSKSERTISSVQEDVRSSSNWRAAKSLTKLRNQLDTAYPNRSKASDGFIGDASHCPNPDGTGSSDHCPNIQDGDTRVVAAYDATHDPGNNCDMEAVVEAIRTSRDARIKYIIWNRRICNSSKIGTTEAWEWRSYSGSNPHTRHAHFSVLPEKAKYDSEAEWSITSTPSASSDLTS